MARYVTEPSLFVRFVTGAFCRNLLDARNTVNAVPGMSAAAVALNVQIGTVISPVPSLPVISTSTGSVPSVVLMVSGIAVTIKSEMQK